jgi:hypothetical protein
MPTYTVTFSVNLTAKQEKMLRSFTLTEGEGPGGTYEFDARAFDHRVLNGLVKLGLCEWFMAPCGTAVRLTTKGLLVAEEIR